MSQQITLPNGREARTSLPKIASVHPFGSKILIEALNANEVLETNLHISNKTKVEGAPQGLIIELGPGLPENSGLQVGQRVYWSGSGTAVSDPRAKNGRVRAMLEVSNILGIIEEAK